MFHCQINNNVRIYIFYCNDRQRNLLLYQIKLPIINLYHYSNFKAYKKIVNKLFMQIISKSQVYIIQPGR